MIAPQPDNMLAPHTVSLPCGVTALCMLAPYTMSLPIYCELAWESDALSGSKHQINAATLQEDLKAAVPLCSLPVNIPPCLPHCSVLLPWWPAECRDAAAGT